MASPPFSISASLPGDSDIVSQHPLNARAFRDIVQSWLLIDHNNLGQHSKVTMPWAAAPAAPGANLSILYFNANGNLLSIDASSAYFVGPPPGSVIYSAAAGLENGYLRPDGSAVSRSTFAQLFARLGILYGPGDGSTTFNLPNLKGRIIAGYDAAGSLITTANGGLDTTTLGATGGVPNFALNPVNLPPYTPTGTVTTTINGGVNQAVSDGSLVNQAPGANAVKTVSLTTITATSSFSGVSNGGTSTPVKTIPPAIVLQPMIKY